MRAWNGRIPRRAPPYGDVFLGLVTANQGPLGLATVTGKCTPCVVEVRDPRAHPTVRVFPREDPGARAKGAVIRYRAYHGVVAPLWALALAGAVAPVLRAARAVRRRHRRGSGVCPR